MILLALITSIITVNISGFTNALSSVQQALHFKYLNEEIFLRDSKSSLRTSNHKKPNWL